MAVCVGYSCDTKSKLVRGRYLLGCKEKLQTEPWQVQAPCALPFYFTDGQPAEGIFNLRGSVLHSSTPKPCHVLSIDPFCSLLKQPDWEEKSRRVIVYLFLVAVARQALCWQPGKWSLPGYTTKVKGLDNAVFRHLALREGTVSLGKARSGPSAWGRSRVCVRIQEWLKFKVRWLMHLFLPRRYPCIALLSAVLNWSCSHSHLGLSAQT